MRKLVTLLALFGLSATAHANLLDHAVAGTMERIARDKQDRVFHANGHAYHATFYPSSGEPGQPAIVRLSRGGATRKQTGADILGLAIKIEGPVTQDILMISTWGDRGLKARVPIFARDFSRRAFTTVSSFEYAGTHGVVATQTGAIAVDSVGEATGVRRDARFALSMPLRSGLFDREKSSRSLGSIALHLDRPLSDDESATLKFSPVNDGRGLHPIGLVNRLRRPAYQGSQVGRGLGRQG